MRFITAVVLFAVSALCFLLGVGQQLLWPSPPRLTEQIPVSQAGGVTPLLVLDGSVLQMHPGKATVQISGDGDVFAATAPASDVDAWVADTRASKVSWQGEAAGLSVEQSGTADSAPNPRGSDLWIQEQSQPGSVSVSEGSQGGAVLVATDGTSPAPSSVTVTWPNENPHPWALPLVVVGYVLLIGGIVLVVLEFRSNRPGPRRRSHRAQKLSPRARRRASRRRGVTARAVSAALGVSLALTGCAAGQDSESQSETAPAPDDASAPAVSKAHFQTILTRVSDAAKAADQSLNPADLANRFAGAALQERSGFYEMKTKSPEKSGLAPFTDAPIKIFLPQAGRDFPRTVLVAVEDDSTDTHPVRLMYLQQASARENYQVVSIVDNVIAQVPNLPSEFVGSTVVKNDSTLFDVPPGQVGQQYTDVLANGDASVSAAAFDLANDKFAAKINQEIADQRNQLGADASLDVTRPEGASRPVAMLAEDGSAVVSASFDETWTVKPTNPNGVINLAGDDKAVLGKDTTSTGVERRYTTMVLFKLPAKGKGPIELLGFTQLLTQVKEL